MSKWGYVSATDAKQKFESDPDFACHMVYEMATLVIKQEAEISTQKDKLLELQIQLASAQCDKELLRGYIKRVRETDNLDYDEKLETLNGPLRPSRPPRHNPVGQTE